MSDIDSALLPLEFWPVLWMPGCNLSEFTMKDLHKRTPPSHAHLDFFCWSGAQHFNICIFVVAGCMDESRGKNFLVKALVNQVHHLFLNFLGTSTKGFCSATGTSTTELIKISRILRSCCLLFIFKHMFHPLTCRSFLLLLSCNLLGLHFRNGGSPCGGSISTGLHGSDWTACDRTPQSEIGTIHAECLDSKGNLEANFQSSPVWSRLESMAWNSTFAFCEKLPKNTLCSMGKNFMWDWVTKSNWYNH